jgi:hypothetical protein
MLRKLPLAFGLAVACVALTTAHLARADGADAQRVLTTTRDPNLPPPPSVSRDPRVARDRIRAQLVQSGSARRSSLASDGGAIIRGASKLQPTELVIGAAECYAAGCTARVTVRHGGEFPKWQRELSHALKRQWKGGVIVTGPEDQPDGATQCSLFLLDDAHP